MTSSLQPTIERIAAAKESTTQQATAKANEILNTHYGELALQGVDSTSVLVNRFLDHFFPAVVDEEEIPGIYYFYPFSNKNLFAPWTEIFFSPAINKILHFCKNLNQKGFYMIKESF